MVTMLLLLLKARLSDAENCTVSVNYR